MLGNWSGYGIASLLGNIARLFPELSERLECGGNHSRFRNRIHAAHAAVSPVRPRRRNNGDRVELRDRRAVGLCQAGPITGRDRTNGFHLVCRAPGHRARNGLRLGMDRDSAALDCVHDRHWFFLVGHVAFVRLEAPFQKRSFGNAAALVVGRRQIVTNPYSPHTLPLNRNLPRNRNQHTAKLPLVGAN